MPFQREVVFDKDTKESVRPYKLGANGPGHLCPSNVYFVTKEMSEDPELQLGTARREGESDE